jgi:hypothetical protein
MTFDWRMDKASYFMIAFIFLTITYFVLNGEGKGLEFIGFIQVFLLAIFSTIALIGLACIPVIIGCYFIKKIPDIDYAVWIAFGMTIVGIITELI